MWMTPLGARTLLGVPAGELGGGTADLADVLGADGRRLAERLREAPGWRQRWATLDEFLLRRLDRGPQPPPEIGWAWERLVASGGAVPIGRLVEETGWSHRHLIAKFKEHVGLRPKTVARLARFDGVWRRLGTERRPDWGRLAADAGMPTRPTSSASSASSPAPPRPSTSPAPSRPAGRSIPFKTRPPPAPSLAVRQAGQRAEGGAMRTGPFWDGVEGRAPIPPAAATLGLEFLGADVDAGTIELAFTASGDFVNPAGNVLGAFVAAMLYETVGPAPLATLDPDQFQSTRQLSVSFLRPVRPGRILGRGRIVHRDGDLVALEASLTGADGEVIAAATATATVIPLRRAAIAP
jgi:acyl-coenzyme A thioesterase PaaI-like protein